MKNKKEKSKRIPDAMDQLESNTRHLESQIRGDFFSLGRGLSSRPLIGTMGESREEFVASLRNRTDSAINH